MRKDHTFFFLDNAAGTLRVKQKVQPANEKTPTSINCERITSFLKGKGV